jgi:5-methylcytosine-specific restriction protein A
MYLAVNPLCTECARVGRTEPATDVDHKIARRDRPDLAFAWDNLNSLCHSHHSQKTARERMERSIQ